MTLLLMRYLLGLFLVLNYALGQQCTVADCSGAERALLARIFERTSMRLTREQWEEEADLQEVNCFPVDGEAVFEARSAIFEKAQESKCFRASTAQPGTLVTAAGLCNWGVDDQLAYFDAQDSRFRVPLLPALLKAMDHNGTSAQRISVKSLSIPSYRWLRNHLRACVEQCLDEADCASVFSARLLTAEEGLLTRGYMEFRPFSWTFPDMSKLFVAFARRPCLGPDAPACNQGLFNSWAPFMEKNTPTEMDVLAQLDQVLPKSSEMSQRNFDAIVGDSKNISVMMNFYPELDSEKNVLHVMTVFMLESAWRLFNMSQVESLINEPLDCWVGCTAKSLLKGLALNTRRDLLLTQFSYSANLRFLCESDACADQVRQSQKNMLTREPRLLQANAYLKSILNNVAYRVLYFRPVDPLLFYLAISVEIVSIIIALCIFLYGRKSWAVLGLMSLILGATITWSALRIPLHVFSYVGLDEVLTSMNPGTCFSYF